MDIRIVSKSEEAQKTAKNSSFLTSIYALVYSDPSNSEFSRKIYLRELLRSSGLSREFVYSFVPYKAYEKAAIGYMNMINNNVAPKSMFSRGIPLDVLDRYISQCKVNDQNRNLVQRIRAQIMSMMEEESQSQ